MSPLYEYRCPSCLTVEERLVRARDKDDQACEACGEPLVRRMSRASVEPSGRHSYGK